MSDEPPRTPEPADVEIAVAESGPTAVAVSVLSAPAWEQRRPQGHLVAIDADLSSLEWLKASLDGLCRRVHIFQHRDAAFDRIRQYLTRGIVPTVVVSDADGARRGPARVRASFAGCARSHPRCRSSRCAPSTRAIALPTAPDGVVFRPERPNRRSEALASLSRARDPCFAPSSSRGCAASTG